MVQNLMKFDQENIIFHHTGIITSDINLSVSFFSSLGYKSSKIYNDDQQQSYIALLNKPNSPMIELITPINNKSPAEGWIKRIGSGAYHICFEIKNVSLIDAIDYYKSFNFTPVSKPTLSPVFKGSNAVFLWGKPGGLIELLGSI